MVIRRLTVGSFAANCYLVMDDASKAGFVIDPGGEGDRIVKELSRMDMKTKAILLTHGHYDHFAGVDPVAEFTGAPVRINRHDACWYSRIPSFFGPVPAPKTPLGAYLEPGDLLRAGDLSLQVIDAPGHTAGGLCFYGDGVLFSGDSLFRRSVGRCDLPGGNWEVLRRSIQENLFSLPSDTVVYCGHGESTTIGEEKEKNPYL